MINMILMVLIEMTSINILELYMILKVLIEMASMNILELYVILKVLIETIYNPTGFDKYGKIKTSKAKSFEDQ